MLKLLERTERALVRLEGWILVVCVVAMLVLAAYNVFYRNALMPLQARLSTSGPPVTSDSEDDESANRPEYDGSEPDETEPDESDPEGAGEFAGGFGAPNGEEAGGEERDSEKEKRDEERGGGESEFRGGFGSDEGGETGDEEGRADDEDDKDDKDESDDFEGGFGAPEPGGEEDGGESDDSAGFEGGFGGSDAPESAGGGESEEAEGSTARDRAPAEDDSEEPEGGPPPDGSLAAAAIAIIDAVKLSWVDVFLRHMVLIVGFLGATVAVRRREHITIDAVGQYVSGRLRHGFGAVTSLFAVVVCIFLAKAGADLVFLGVEDSSELFLGVRQWAVQLVFPIGFGLLALHFALRGLGDAIRTYTGQTGSEFGPPDDETPGLVASDPSDSEELTATEPGAEEGAPEGGSP